MCSHLAHVSNFRIGSKYIAEREGIPIEQLVVANQHRREYELLGRAFWAVTVLDIKSGRWYNVMVDLADGRVVEDVEAIEQAEEEAHRAKYGKLEPVLFERLQTLRDDEEVPVVIWVAGAPRRSEEELYTALVVRYPEAQAALERSGEPFDVSDRELNNELEVEYVRMLEADVQEQIQPLVRHLEWQGHTVTTLGALPAIAVTLPKAAILEIVERADVGVVYLNEDKVQRLLDSAVSSDHVPAVWQRGFKGNGVNIGILEPGEVDFTGPVGHNYLHQGASRPCAGGVDWHKTMVASAAGSFHDTYMGVAPEATIVDACTDLSGTDTVLGLEWATARADPINFSGTFNNDRDLHWTDRAFDHWAYIGNDTVVAGTGNVRDGYVGSPAKGWNVLAVGGSDDNNTSGWTDDGMYDNSSWKNPKSDHWDREKPEIVAPAVSITAVALNNNPLTRTGTSLAAPQVAGLAALLIDRNPDLSAWPPAVRAIIMASAMNNIDGPRVIPTGQDLKDGAGAIDAALADEIAKSRSSSSTTPCDGPCWWGFSINNTNFPVGTYLYRYFNASRGERVRVAISWWSNADCPDEDHCNYDRLDTDLNLGVVDPDDQWVDGAWSASWDNNYELVEFVAPKTGQYKIAAYKERADETSNYLGIAWVKDATYLPDLRNKDGWRSEIYVCNNGAEWLGIGDLYVHYFDFDGNPTPKVSDWPALAPNQCCWLPVWEYNRIPAGTTGSAIVSGGEDIAVVVQSDSHRVAAYTGMRSASGDPNWEVVGTDVYFPHVYRHDTWRYVSQLTIFNTGPTATDVYITYRDRDGNIVHATGANYIPANGSITVQPPPNVGNAFYGSARVWSSVQPVAAVADALHYDGNVDFNYTALNGAGTVYLPYLMKQYYGWNSCFTVRNLSESTTNPVYITYYWSSGSRTEMYWVSPSAMLSLCQQSNSYLPDGALSARVWSSYGIPVASAVNQSQNSEGKHMSYSGFAWPSTTVVLPLLLKDGVSGGRMWRSGIQVQNAGSQATNPIITYYDASGQVVLSVSLGSIQAGRSIGVYLPNVSGLPSGFVGSAVVTANQPLVAVANATCNGCSGDAVYTYNGINR